MFVSLHHYYHQRAILKNHHLAQCLEHIRYSLTTERERVKEKKMEREEEESRRREVALESSE